MAPASSDGEKKIAGVLDGMLGEGVEVAPLARPAAEKVSAVGLTGARGWSKHRPLAVRCGSDEAVPEKST